MGTIEMSFGMPNVLYAYCYGQMNQVDGYNSHVGESKYPEVVIYDRKIVTAGSAIAIVITNGNHAQDYQDFSVSGMAIGYKLVDDEYEPGCILIFGVALGGPITITVSEIDGPPEAEGYQISDNIMLVVARVAFTPPE